MKYFGESNIQFQNASLFICLEWIETIEIVSEAINEAYNAHKCTKHSDMGWMIQTMYKSETFCFTCVFTKSV